MTPPAGTTARTAPVLETERLRLRAHRADDLDAFAAIWSDPVVTRYLGRAASPTRQDAWMRMLRYPGLWALLGYGFWAVEEKASGRCIGDIGFADFKREIDPPLDGMLETGWVLAADAHGKGYASEGLAAALAWSEAELPGRTAACIIEPENAASIRVAVKAGFREWRRTVSHGDSILVFPR